MNTEHDTLDGLNELAAVANRQPPHSPERQPKRPRVPSRRILTAGGIVLRAFGVLLVTAGFWPFLWTILEAVMLFSGNVENQAHFKAADGSFAVHLRGWPAILFGLLWSGLTWCIALVVIALGHALYAVRDLIETVRVTARQPAD